MRLSLQWKVLLGYLAITGIGLGTAGWLALDALETSDMEQVRMSLQTQARLAAQLFVAPLSQPRPDSAAIDAQADRIGSDLRTRVTVIAPDGTVLGDSYESGEGLRRMDNHLGRPEVREALASGLGISTRLSDTVDIRMFYLALPIRAADAGPRLLGFIRLALPLTDIESRHLALRRMLAAALGGAFLLSLALSYLIAPGVPRPLGDLVAAAHPMGRVEFRADLPKAPTAEVSHLAESLNHLASSLDETMKNLHRLEQVRKDFVANVSHELRTPLTAIKGYIEALEDGGKTQPEQLDRFLGIIKAHAERLNFIITDLLLLSKIESGQIPLKREPVALPELLDRTLNLLRPLIDRKRHRVTVRLPESVPPAMGDEERLAQVFSNLLDNAIKYTPDEGNITIAASSFDQTVEVSVTDSGIGIPAQDLPRIFERFYRVDKARSRELGGTGLGLAIVKHLVEGQEGTIRVESEPGKGTCFRIRLPATSDAR